MANESDHLERIAVLEVQVQALTKSVDELTTQVRTLVGLFEQAKGARWMLVGLAAVGGFIAGKGAMIASWLGLPK